MLAGITVVKACAIRAVAEFIDLIAPDLGKLLPFERTVYRVAVCVCDGGRVVGGFHSALYLEARNARVNELGYVIYHAHIARVHDVCAIILCDIEIFAGALFLDKAVFPAAGLSACAAVCVASRQIVRQQTAPGK